MPNNAASLSTGLVNKPRFFQQAAITPAFIKVNESSAVVDPSIVASEVIVTAKPLIDPGNLSVQVGEVKLFNPELSVLLSGVTPATDGVAKTDISVPLSATENVTDEQLFEAPGDAAKKYYLPRYRLLEIPVTTGHQFDVVMKQSGSSGSVEIRFEKYPAASIEEVSKTALEIDHLVSILLQFDVSMQGGGAMQKELPFPEISKDANGIQAKLPVNSLTQFTQVYQAMTESSFNARLIIRRVITVALPVTPPPPENTGIIPSTYWKVKESTRLSSNAIVVTLDGTATAPEGENILYRQTSRSLDDTIPFTFPLALHGYIFKDIAANSNSTGPGLINHQLDSNRFGTHRYYEDTVQPGVFYYLPDSFKIARRPAPSYAPFMCITLNGDGSLDKTRVTIEYVAIPYTNTLRIQEAESQLKASMDSAHEIQFMPLIAHAKFMLALPGPEDDSAGPYRERMDAMVELREGIHDSVTLSLKNFQLIYDALMGASLTLFMGQVIVSVTDKDNINIPFSARMNDLAGDVYTVRQQYDSNAGKGNIVIRNEIESPLMIKSVQVMLSDGNLPVPFNSEGVDLSAMLKILPLQEATINIVPQDDSIVSKALEINTALSDVQTQPDREAIWKAILNPYTPIEYERTIVVETFDELFSADPQADSDKSVKAILINFLNGNTVTLKASALQANATVNVSLSNYILGKEDTREYKFQVEVVTLAGKRKIGGPDEWITDNADELFITKDLIS